MRRIDAHHHLWRFNGNEYAWLEGDLLPLRRDFLPNDFALAMKLANVIGSVVVQARQTVGETDWLLALAADEPKILGVVGWLPLRDPALPEQLERFRSQTKLVGLRHVLQAEPDGFQDDPAFRRGIAALAGSGLVYDLLIYAHQLPEATRLVRSFPNQVFVLDHLAKPAIRRREWEFWADNLRVMAELPNIFCKLSGMVTEAGVAHWTQEQLHPYFEIALKCFTPSRLMAGSDWPVLLAGCTYERWWALLDEWTATLTAGERADILAGTAERAYGLRVPSASQTPALGEQA